MDEVRIDKFLWSIRVYKSRNEATDACKGGKVKVNGSDTKPARTIKAGDSIVIRKGIIELTFRVIEPIDKRQGAANVARFAENLTPQSEYDKLRAPRESFFFKRDPGTGRPTKKDRRQMDAVFTDFDFSGDNSQDFDFSDFSFEDIDDE